ncbi:polymorphic toxin-type HINT domain-containing protein [Archangium violaceum]|uniref:polymorphic toxin-type HINT domain-containing protein n=1 Tax=Archangium violaceum TaxID=83451 RepID=UPI002B31C13B|nr:polymorphic toxin-type HINT domain-containing protein [Archangium gephyra]
MSVQSLRQNPRPVSRRHAPGFPVLLLAALALLAAGCESNAAPRSAGAQTLSTLPTPSPEETVQVFNARKGTWEPGLPRDVQPEGELIHAGRLMRRHGTTGALEWLHGVDVARLADADATYEPKAEHRFPTGDDVVYVTGKQGHHAVLAHVGPGQKLTFQGRLYETKADASTGGLLLRFTGTTLNRVTQTFQRRTDTLVELTVRYGATGREDTLSGTPEHPFFVPAAGDYIAMGRLAPGTVLLTPDGSEATVVTTTTHPGDAEVFNFEVEQAHNYFVSAPGSDGPGVLVHNTCTFTTRTTSNGASTGIRETTVDGRTFSVNSDHAWSRGHKSGVKPSSTGVGQDALESAMVKDLDGHLKAGGTVPAPGRTNYDRTLTVDGKQFGYRSVSLPSGEVRITSYWVNP